MESGQIGGYSGDAGLDSKCVSILLTLSDSPVLICFDLA
jgi:hypothetical protein